MKTTGQALHDFWFEAATPQRLAIMRILVGVFTLFYIVPAQDVYVKIAQTDPRLYAPVGIVFGGPMGLDLFHWLLRATIAASFAFTLGLWHRVSGPAFAGLMLWLCCYRNSWSMIYHSENLIVLHGIVLGFTRSADAYSLDQFVRRLGQRGGASGRGGWQYGWPIKLMNALTVSAYFITAVAKLAGPLGLSWMTGRALRSQMAVDQIRKELLGSEPNPLSYTLYDWLPLFAILAVGSMAVEILAPLALLNRRVGRVWAVNAFLMHWGILAVMKITFPYQLSGIMYAPFFPIERVPELVSRLWARGRGSAALEPEDRPADGASGAPALPAVHGSGLFHHGKSQ